MSFSSEPILAIWAGLAGFIAGLVMKKIGYFRRFQAILIAFVLNVVFVSVFSFVNDFDSSYTTTWIAWSSILLISLMLILAPQVGLRQIGAAQQSPQSYQVSLATGKDAWFYQIWWTVFTKPKEANYLELTENKKASWQKAYWWVFASGLSGGVLGFFEIIEEGVSTTLTFGIVLGILSLIGFVIESLVIYVVAQVEGGTGSYSSLVYLLSAINAPIMGINSFLVTLSLVKGSNNPSAWLIGLTIFISLVLVYTAILGIITTKATNKFSLTRSIVAVLPYRILLIIVIIVVSIYLYQQF